MELVVQHILRMEILLRFGVIIIYEIIVPLFALLDEVICVELLAIIGLHGLAGVWRRGRATCGESHPLVGPSALYAQELLAYYKLILKEAEDTKDPSHKHRGHETDNQRRVVGVIIRNLTYNRNLRRVLIIQLDTTKGVLVLFLTINVHKFILCIENQFLSILHDHKFHALWHLEN